MGRECLYEYGYDSNRQVQINLHEYCIWFFERLIIFKLSHVSKYDNTAKITKRKCISAEEPHQVHTGFQWLHLILLFLVIISCPLFKIDCFSSHNIS